jgi:hypothetical protein
MAWLSGALAVACVAVGLLHLLRLVVLRRDVVGEATHAAMAVGMAAMSSPLGDPVPELVWATVFVLCGAWFAALAVRARSVRGDAGHHVVGTGAMLFMLLSGHSHAPGTGGSEHAGHLGHGGGPEGALGIGSVAAIVLAGYFAWHVLRCSDRLRSCALAHAPNPAASAVAGPAPGGAVALRTPALSVRAPQTAAVAHLVMGAAMTVMLLGMV